MSRRFDGLYIGMCLGGDIFCIEDSPVSIIISRTSAAVAATKAIGLKPSFAHLIVSSAPVRVLPPPRPLSNSHIYQSQSGGNCFGRAHIVQSYSKDSNSCGLRLLYSLCLSCSGSKAIDCANELCFCIMFYPKTFPYRISYLSLIYHSQPILCQEYSHIALLLT